MFATDPPRLKAQDSSPAQATPPVDTNTVAASAESPAVYKKMSLEELMDQDVTSVSRQPEPYGQAPAAIVVITQDPNSPLGSV